MLTLTTKRLSEGLGKLPSNQQSPGQMARWQVMLQGKLMASYDSEIILQPLGRGDSAIELTLQRILFQLNQHLWKKELDCTVCGCG